MSAQQRPSRRHVGEESLEERRHRMPVAQRKHRARKEQTIAHLEEQLDAAHAKLDEVRRAFSGLEHAIEQSSINESRTSRTNFEPAMNAIRAALASSQAAQSDKHHGNTNKPQLPKSYFDSMPFWDDDTSMTPPDECPGSFAILLYEHCTNFAVRILACEKGPLNTLARRLFHHYLLQMKPPDSRSRLDVLRECMEQRAQQIAHVQDARGRACMGKVFRKPRIPGFMHYLDASQVEETLRSRGFDFDKGPDVVHIVIPGSASAKSTPDLETDSSDSDDMLDQQERESSEPWWDNSDCNPHGRTASYDGLDMRSNPTLPFGLNDQGDNDAELLPGFGLRKSAMSVPPNPFDTDFVSSLNPIDYRRARSEEYESVPRQHVIEVSMSDLLKRLVSIGICIGAPGPGWRPEDVNRVAEELMQGV